MERRPLKSTTLRGAGYDAVNRVLEIEFSSGDVYQYLSVPLVIYEGLMRAPSAGKYHAKAIKDGGFVFKKVVSGKRSR